MSSSGRARCAVWPTSVSPPPGAPTTSSDGCSKKRRSRWATIWANGPTSSTSSAWCTPSSARRSRPSGPPGSSWPTQRDSTPWCRSGATRRPRLRRTNGPCASTSSTGSPPIRSSASSRPRQYTLIPVFFGLPQAEVVEETCQCRGDEACLFRIRWDEVDPAQSRVDYLEMRTQVLEARLEQLQDMVTDLASNERYEDVLQGIVASSMRSVGASGALLALEPRDGSPRRIYSEGLTEPRGRCHGRRPAGRRGPRERDRGRGRLGPSPLRGPRHRRTGWPVQLAVPEHAHDVRPVGGGNARRRGCHGPSPAPGQYGAGAARTLHLAVRAGQPGGNGREGGARRAGRDRMRLRGRLPRRRGLAEDGRHQLPPGGVLRLLRRDDGGDQHAGLPRDARRPGGRDGDRALVVAGDRNRADHLGPDQCVGQNHRCGDGRGDGRSGTADHHAADRRSPQGPGRPGLHRHHECRGWWSRSASRPCTTR